jgi:hypothetical protein
VQELGVPGFFAGKRSAKNSKTGGRLVFGLQKYQVFIFTGFFGPTGQNFGSGSNRIAEKSVRPGSQRSFKDYFISG